MKAEIETKIQNERFAAEYKNYMKKAWTEATIWIAPSTRIGCRRSMPRTDGSIAPQKPRRGAPVRNLRCDSLRCVRDSPLDLFQIHD